jgi:hypothetical protein
LKLSSTQGQRKVKAEFQSKHKRKPKQKSKQNQSQAMDKSVRPHAVAAGLRYTCGRVFFRKALPMASAVDYARAISSVS